MKDKPKGKKQIDKIVEDKMVEETSDSGGATEDGKKPIGDTHQKDKPPERHIKRKNKIFFIIFVLILLITMSFVGCYMYLASKAPPSKEAIPAEKGKKGDMVGGETDEYLVYNSTVHRNLPPHCHDLLYLDGLITNLLVGAGCARKKAARTWRFVCQEYQTTLALSLIPREIPDRIAGVEIAVQWKGSNVRLGRYLRNVRVPRDLEVCFFDVKRIAPIEARITEMVYRYPEQMKCKKKMCPEYCKKAGRFLLAVKEAAEGNGCGATISNNQLNVRCSKDYLNDCKKILTGTFWTQTETIPKFVIEYAGSSSQACNGNWYAKISSESPDFGFGLPDFVIPVIKLCQDNSEDTNNTRFVIVDLSSSMVDQIEDYPAVIVSALHGGTSVTVVGFSNEAEAISVTVNESAIRKALHGICKKDYEQRKDLYRQYRQSMQLQLIIERNAVCAQGSNLEMALYKVRSIESTPSEIIILTDGIVGGVAEELSEWIVNRGVKVRAYTWGGEDTGSFSSQIRDKFEYFIRSSRGSLIELQRNWR